MVDHHCPYWTAINQLGYAPMITGRHDPTIITRHMSHRRHGAWSSPGATFAACWGYYLQHVVPQVWVGLETHPGIDISWYILEIHAQHLSSIYHTSGRDLYSSSIHQFGYGFWAMGPIPILRHPMWRCQPMGTNSPSVSPSSTPQTLSQNKITAK
jgi:hypothetical protein